MCDGNPTEPEPGWAGVGGKWVVWVVNEIGWNWLIDGMEGENAREDLGRESSNERHVVAPGSHGAHNHIQGGEFIVNRMAGGTLRGDVVQESESRGCLCGPIFLDGGAMWCRGGFDLHSQGQSQDSSADVIRRGH